MKNEEMQSGFFHTSHSIAGAFINKTIKKRFHSSFHRIVDFLYFYDAFQILQVQEFFVYAP